MHRRILKRLLVVEPERINFYFSPWQSIVIEKIEYCFPEIRNLAASSYVNREVRSFCVGESVVNTKLGYTSSL